MIYPNGYATSHNLNIKCQPATIPKFRELKVWFIGVPHLFIIKKIKKIKE
jgi:hypothetical protein